MTEVRLKDILDKKHALYQLADRLNWDALIEGFGPYYSESLFKIFMQHVLPTRQF